MTSMKEAIRLFITTLQEILDEAAYSRVLDRTHSDSCPAAYAAFWRERESKAPKPRCC